MNPWPGPDFKAMDDRPITTTGQGIHIRTTAVAPGRALKWNREPLDLGLLYPKIVNKCTKKNKKKGIKSHYALFSLKPSLTPQALHYGIQAGNLEDHHKADHQRVDAEGLYKGQTDNKRCEHFT